MPIMTMKLLSLRYHHRRRRSGERTTAAYNNSIIIIYWLLTLHTTMILGAAKYFGGRHSRWRQHQLQRQAAMTTTTTTTTRFPSRTSFLFTSSIDKYNKSNSYFYSSSSSSSSSSSNAAAFAVHLKQRQEERLSLPKYSFPFEQQQKQQQEMTRLQSPSFLSSSSSCLFAHSSPHSDDDNDNVDDGDYWESGRAFKCFSDAEEMAYNYNPEEYDVIPTEDFMTGSRNNDDYDDDSFTNSISASIYDDDSQQEQQQKPPIREERKQQQRQRSNDISSSEKSYSPPPPQPKKTNDNFEIWDSPSSSTSNFDNSRSSDDYNSNYQTRRTDINPPTRRSWGNNSWNPASSSSSWKKQHKEEEELDLTNWHPHTAGFDPVDKDGNDNGNDEASSINGSIEINGSSLTDSDGETIDRYGNIARSVSPPLRKQQPQRQDMPPSPNTNTIPKVGMNEVGSTAGVIMPPLRRKARQEEVSSPPPPSQTNQALHEQTQKTNSDAKIDAGSKPKQRPPNPSAPAPPSNRSRRGAAKIQSNSNDRDEKKQSQRRAFSSSSTFPNEKPALSREEFRARFAFDDISEAVPAEDDDNTKNDSETTFGAPPAQRQQQQRRVPPPPSSSSSYSSTNRRSQEDTEYMFECEIQRLEDAIYEQNGGQKFNLKSYKQISMVLFGKPNESTSKDVLETMSIHNEMAKLILQHRQASQRLTKVQNLKKKQANKSKLIEQLPKKNKNNGTKSVDSLTSTNDSSDDNNNQVQAATTSVVTTEPLMLVDTSSLIFRAYYSMPPMHRNGDGMPIAAVMGFCNMINSLILNKLLRGERPRLILCCDTFSGPKTFRHEMYPEYKAHRPEAPMDLIPQFELIRQAARAYGMLQVQATGYEADDVIATLSRQALKENKSVNILSIDKDLWQLVTKPQQIDEGGSRRGGARIEMLDPVTMTQVTHELVEEKWGVPPEQLGDVLALAGDAADNIPGVPSIGPKIAAKLISEFGTLDNLLAKSDEIPQTKRRETLQTHAEQAKLSQGLVRLEQEIPLEKLELDPPTTDDETDPMAHPITEWRMEPLDPDRLLAFYDEMGFVTIKKRLLDRLKTQKFIPFNQSRPTSSPEINPKRKKTGYSQKSKTGIPDPEDYKDVPF